VNSIERNIIRSWNWPNEENNKYSSKPTPYNISKMLNIPSGTVYRYWKSIQDHGMMNKLIILPSENLFKRKIFLLSNVQLSDFMELSSLMDDLYFLETIHYFQVYESVGVEFMSHTNNKSIAVVINQTTDHLARRRLNLILKSLKNKEIRLAYESQPQDNVILKPSETEKKILLKILYEDLNQLNINKLADEIKMNTRTIRRYLDSIVSKSYVELYPKMSQHRVLNHKLAAMSIFSNVNLKELLSRSPIKDRYLLFRKFSTISNILIDYESSEELEACIDQLRDMCGKFFVSLTYRTSISPSIKENMTGIIPW